MINKLSFKSLIERDEAKAKRVLEIATGLLIWSIILFPVWGSLLIPEVVAYLIIGFNVYWLYKSLQITIYGLRGYREIKKAEATDWQKLYLDNKARASLDWGDIYHVVIIPTAGESVAKLSSNLDALKNQTLDTHKYR